MISSPAEMVQSRAAGDAKRRPWRALLLIVVVWMGVYGAALWRPALLDDADATHAQAARAMLTSGDWVTLHVNGVRYLEKAPLPYWMAAVSLRVFAPRVEDLPRWGAFAVHLPVALAVLGMALLGYAWARRAFAGHGWGTRAALYTALFVLTSFGMFLFTRVFLPDALLSLLLCLALYFALRAMEAGERRCGWFAYGFWVALALAVLTKGLLALVLVPGALLVCFALTGEWREVRRLRPWSGGLLLLAIAAPWHVLAGLRNTGGADGHGFFWFYFVNEHLLRFLGRREPRDYNKVPAVLYWVQHVLWLFPWSFFVPMSAGMLTRGVWRVGSTFEDRSQRLLVVFTGLTMMFFALSTNQEYYTLPVYLPVLLLTAAALARAETMTVKPRMLMVGQAMLCVVCAAAALALAWGLWESRAASGADLATVMAHRGLGEYTLATSHLYDLTAAAIGALRLPAVLAMMAMMAMMAFSVGTPAAWWLRCRRRERAATMTLVMTAAVFLVAAQMAFVRFAPVLSSADFAARIQELEKAQQVDAGTEVLLFGDQAGGSSLPFYLGHTVVLVDGRSTSMLFGSTFPDVPPVFVSSGELRSQWGREERKLLFVPAERRAEALQMFGASAVRVADSSGKLLLTDRPFDAALQTGPRGF